MNATESIVEGYKSEMNVCSYNSSSLAWYIRYILNYTPEPIIGDSDLSIIIEKIEKVLNSSNPSTTSAFPAFEPLYKKKSFSLKTYTDEMLYDNLFDIKSIELTDGKSVQISHEISGLYKSLTFFTEDDQHPVYSDRDITKYLEKYFQISRDYIFNPKNSNLNNLLFRRSTTLEALNCIGKIPVNNLYMAQKGYAYYNIGSPYVCDALQRTVYNIINNYSRLNRITELKKIRTEIFVNQMVRSFTRFTSYNNFTNFRVSLNRHSGELLSVPYSELSSIEEVKPLRLFEKIISHIYSRLNLIRKSSDHIECLDIKVAIIGHTEQSINANKLDGDNQKFNSDNRELADLLRTVMSWYVRTEKKDDDPILKLSIVNLINNGDIVNAENIDQSGNSKLEYKIDMNVGSATVNACNYFEEFYFSKQKLKDLCNEYDLLFILDCPWMTLESYELKNEGLLDFYCSSIQSEVIRDDKRDVLDSDRRTTIQELDTQYNRITSSDSNKSGEISRIFRDDIIKAIKKYIEESTELRRKDMYIFTSERDGVDYSYLGSYPMTRKEMYGGKCFTISHFSNHIFETLDIGEPKITIRIRLWSILKYIAISYAFIYLRNDIEELLPDYDMSPENYFELLRSIIVVMELNSDLNKIDISMRFSENIKLLQTDSDVDGKKLEELKQRVFQQISPFIIALYSNGVFSDKNDFGDNTIQTAFEMNVRSSANDVNSMLFIHHYRLRRANNTLEKFKITWKSEYNSDLVEECSPNHFFKDKRLYEMLLDILQNTSQLSIGTLSTLYKSDDIFNQNNMAQHVLNNIIQTCEKMQYMHSTVYKNAITALNNL